MAQIQRRQGSLTSRMVSVFQSMPQLRTTANSNKIATRIAMRDEGITLKICNGTCRGSNRKAQVIWKLIGDILWPSLVVLRVM